MQLALRIAILLLLLPAAEVLVFLLVAWLIGFFPALALMLATSVGGGVVLWRLGGRDFAQARTGWREPGRPKAAAADSRLLVAAGGILLLLPGFITDILGAGLLVAPLRRRLGGLIGRLLRRDTRAAGPPVIDLEPGEWRTLPDRPRRRRRR
jgi:UPF0716 protein FxsA